MSGTRRPLSKKSRNSHANAMTGTMEPQLPSRLVHKYVATLDNLCNVCGPAMKPTHARLNHACDDKRMQIGAISTLGAFPPHSGPYGSATTTPRHSSAFSVMSSICNIDVVHIVRRYGIHVQHIFRLGTAFAHTTPSVRHGSAGRHHKSASQTHVRSPTHQTRTTVPMSHPHIRLASRLHVVRHVTPHTGPTSHNPYPAAIIRIAHPFPAPVNGAASPHPTGIVRTCRSLPIPYI